MSIELQRPKVVAKRIGYGKTSLYRLVAQGKFPKPIQLGERAVAWPSDQVDAWIAERIKAGRRA
jgi:prophage regulatory protein